MSGNAKVKNSVAFKRSINDGRKEEEAPHVGVNIEYDQAREACLKIHLKIK